MIKLYHEERGTARLRDFIDSEDPVIIVSVLTEIEMISALAKKVRTGEIDENIFSEAVSNFETDVSTFEVIDLDGTVKIRASDLLKATGLQRGLKSLDSLQLASALAMLEPPDLFIVADHVLGDIAEAEGLEVMAF